MEVRRLRKTDCVSFIDTAVMFFNESRNKQLEPDIGKFDKLIREGIKDKYNSTVAVLVGVIDDTVVGYAILNTFQDYTAKPIGDMYQFYVRPDYRGTGISRLLADAIVEQFEQWGCPFSHVCADTGIDEDGITTKLFRNLFAKKGYQVTGVIMTRAHGG